MQLNKSKKTRKQRNKVKQKIKKFMDMNIWKTTFPASK